MNLELGQQIMFWLVGAAMVVAAIRVVTTTQIIHAALYLVVTLLGAAMMYILLLAEFVAWVQVLVYVGAVVVLMLFGLMLTRAPIGRGSYDNDQRVLAGVCSLAVFLVTSFVLVRGFEGQELDLTRAAERGGGPTTRALGEVIFSAYVLPFEVVSVLLLAALVGAVVIARRDAPDAGVEGRRAR